MTFKTNIFYSFVLIAIISFSGCAQSSGEDDLNDPSSDSSKIAALNEPQTPLLQQVKANKFAAKDLQILIDKSAYTLQVLHKDSILITYPCVLGFEPVADKMKEGDGATPEGDFGIRSMYPHHSWSYFIWFDYPNEESWSRFKKRKADGTIEQNATIGGEVGIHGVPVGSDELIANKTNWTLGCISLTTAHITDLYKSINSSTKIRIVE